MKVPNLDKAFVPKEKIVDYLLSTTHRDGRNKAVVFCGFGFRVEAWNELAAVLVNHARMYDVVKEESSLFGTRYVVEGVIDTPSGRTLNLRSVWFLEDGEEIPRFATAYPLKGAGRAQRT
jgi:hypothetical protein